jgi:hypothetical protein
MPNELIASSQSVKELPAMPWRLFYGPKRNESSNRVSEVVLRQWRHLAKAQVQAKIMIEVPANGTL